MEINEGLDDSSKYTEHFSATKFLQTVTVCWKTVIIDHAFVINNVIRVNLNDMYRSIQRLNNNLNTHLHNVSKFELPLCNKQFI
jgi:hypothetical protein